MCGKPLNLPDNSASDILLEFTQVPFEARREHNLVRCHKCISQIQRYRNGECGVLWSGLPFLNANGSDCSPERHDSFIGGLSVNSFLRAGDGHGGINEGQTRV